MHSGLPFRRSRRFDDGDISMMDSAGCCSGTVDFRQGARPGRPNSEVTS